MNSPDLARFLAVIQGRDAYAVGQLLHELDPFLRQIIRMQLIDGKLRHVIETADILQSLLKDFLGRGVDSPSARTDQGGLRAYFAAAVRNKVLKRLRKEERRVGALPDDCQCLSRELPVSQQFEEQELLLAMRSRLSNYEVQILDLRMQGLTWREVAESVGQTPAAVRIRLTRVVGAVLKELGYGGATHAS
jgi:DNA-directed RNA polymerase specialized sigma24 family protein